MRRLLRWTFNALATASLLLCLATAGLWVRSYWVSDVFFAERQGPSVYGRTSEPRHEWTVLSYRGHFVGWAGWSDGPDDQPTSLWEFDVHHATGSLGGVSMDYDFSTVRQFSGGYAYTLRTGVVPYWPLVSAFAVLPAVSAFRQVRAVRRRRRRSRLGLCPACGYDLRASPGRCPECGRERG